jgi:hypothetical protein
MITELELVAVTVNMEELPEVIVLDLAVMATVGAAVASTVNAIWSTVAPPHLSHSSTVVLCEPTLIVISVFNEVAFTT